MGNTRRKPTSMQEHYEIAAAIRDAESAVLHLLGYTRCFYANEDKRLCKTLNSLSMIKSRMEEEMFRDHPFLPREWTDFYYGSQEECDELISDYIDGRIFD